MNSMFEVGKGMGRERGDLIEYGMMRTAVWLFQCFCGPYSLSYYLHVWIVKLMFFLSTILLHRLCRFDV